MNRAFLLALLLVTMAVAQKPPTIQPTKGLGLATDCPLALNAMTIPPGFRAHDIDSVYKHLQRFQKSLEKSEFETSIDYVQRIETAGANIAPLEIGRLLCFVVTGNTNLGIELKYDADTSELKADWFDGAAKNEDERGTFSYFLLSNRKPKPPTSYVAENAFGRKVRVERNYYLRSAIAMRSAYEDSRLRQLSPDFFTFTVKVSRERAPSAKANLGLVVIVKLTSPKSGVGFVTTEPKIDSPYESHYTTAYIEGEIQRVLIADMKSGQVFQ